MVDQRVTASPFSVGATSRESNSHQFKAPKSKRGPRECQYQSKELGRNPKRQEKKLKLMQENLQTSQEEPEGSRDLSMGRADSTLKASELMMMIQDPQNPDMDLN